MPVVPAIQEAEVREPLKPRGRGYSETRLCHCTPAWVTERDSISETTKQPPKKPLTEWKKVFVNYAPDKRLI